MNDLNITEIMEEEMEKEEERYFLLDGWRWWTFLSITQKGERLNLPLLLLLLLHSSSVNEGSKIEYVCGIVYLLFHPMPLPFENWRTQEASNWWYFQRGFAYRRTQPKHPPKTKEVCIIRTTAIASTSTQTQSPFCFGF